MGDAFEYQLSLIGINGRNLPWSFGIFNSSSRSHKKAVLPGRTQGKYRALIADTVTGLIQSGEIDLSFHANVGRDQRRGIQLIPL